MCAYRLTAPGLGKEVGATLGLNQFVLSRDFSWLRRVAACALKGAIFAANVYETSGLSGCTERYRVPS